MSSQEELGDPSGRPSSEYWDEWFETISPSNTPFFEWYCDASEISRILSLNNDDDDNNAILNKQNFNLIHPGSGNSNLPTLLRDEYGFCSHETARQCVIDCSQVAVSEMISKQQQPPESSNNTTKIGAIEYVVGDVLAPPLPYPSETFHGWIDKGLLDALFSCNFNHDERRKCELLFQEANRLLLEEVGVCVVVSLAQEHTLKLILHVTGIVVMKDCEHNEEEAQRKCNSNGWAFPLEVHELKPLSDSSSLRPFAFVLRKKASFSSNSNDDDNDAPLVVLFDEGGQPRQTISRPKQKSSDDELLFQSIHDMVDVSRKEFAEQVEINKQQSIRSDDNDGVNSNNAPQMMVLTFLEIKPFDSETDLTLLSEKLRKCITNDIIEEEEEEEETDEDDNPLFQFQGRVTWRSHKLIPIGFGVSKLRIECIVPSEMVEELCEVIAEVEEDTVQSVDVDWEKTVPIGNADDILRQQISRKK